MDDHDAVARAGIDAVVAELVATRNILGAGEHQTASQRALFIMNERRGLGDALVALLESLHSMPYEDRTPAVHAAVVRAKKVLGIEG